MSAQEWPIWSPHSPTIGNATNQSDNFAISSRPGSPHYDTTQLTVLAITAKATHLSQKYSLVATTSCFLKARHVSELPTSPDTSRSRSCTSNGTQLAGRVHAASWALRLGPPPHKETFFRLWGSRETYAQKLPSELVWTHTPQDYQVHVALTHVTWICLVIRKIHNQFSGPNLLILLSDIRKDMGQIKTSYFTFVQ